MKDRIYYQQDATRDSIKLAKFAEALRQAKLLADQLPSELLEEFGTLTFVGEKQLTLTALDRATGRGMRRAWENALVSHKRHDERERDQRKKIV